MYSLDQKKSFQLTDDVYIDFSPVFSTCGKYIFFLSDRNFNLSFSSFEFDYVYRDSTNIYAIALTDAGALSADKKKILYRARNKFGIIDLKPDQKVGTGELNTGHCYINWGDFPRVKKESS